MTRLSMDHISRENPNSDLSSTTSLQLSHRHFTDVSCLASFTNLERLDLSYNCLISLESLSACVNLKWLQVMENKLLTLKGIEGLSKLTVLNAGRNKLEKMDEICALSKLGALILNDNNISSICKLDQMRYLNTLVLSRNPIHVIGDSLNKATSITKLSLSHCKLQSIGSSLAGCLDLKEARFSHNEITALPENLSKNIKLRTLDVGNNLIEKLSEVKVLSALNNLKNLNLLGNPIAENDKLIKKVKRLVPNIRIFNAKPLESSNMTLKVSDKESLLPTKTTLQNTFGFEDDRKRKTRESKKDDAFGRKRLNASDSNLFRNFTDIESGQKKIMMNSVTDDYSTPSGILTDNLSDVVATRKKTKPKTEILEKKTSASVEKNISNKVEKKPGKERESSLVKLGVKFQDIDDEDAPFVDLIFSGKKTVDNLENEQVRETLTDVKFVQRSKSVKRRHKNMDDQLSALQFFSSKDEIGLGGQSTWDA